MSNYTTDLVHGTTWAKLFRHSQAIADGPGYLCISRSIDMKLDKEAVRDMVFEWSKSEAGSKRERELWKQLRAIKDGGVVRDGDQLLLDI